jgi:hypothetical protein
MDLIEIPPQNLKRNIPEPEMWKHSTLSQVEKHIKFYAQG